VTVPELGTYACSDINTQANGPGVNSSICTAFQQDIVRSTCCRPVYPTCLSMCRGGEEMSRSTEDCKFGVNDSSSDSFDTRLSYTSSFRAMMKPTVATFTNLTSDTEVTLSCYEIYYGSNIDGSISSETCYAFEDVFRKACCADRASEFYTCSICGDGEIAFPEAIITDYRSRENASCSLLGQAGEEGYLNRWQCLVISEDAASICCNSTPSASPTINDNSLSPTIIDDIVSPPSNKVTINISTGTPDSVIGVSPTKDVATINDNGPTPDSGVDSLASPLISVGMLLSVASFLLTLH